ncbi:Kinesin-like protein KIN-14B, partial [Mucuna pruriens]
MSQRTERWACGGEQRFDGGRLQRTVATTTADDDSQSLDAETELSDGSQWQVAEDYDGQRQGGRWRTHRTQAEQDSALIPIIVVIALLAILQQMKSDIALLTLENGGSPIQNPSTATEDARLASLISLDSILKQIKDITKLSSVNILSKSKKKKMRASLDELAEQMPSLLVIDHPCAQRHIADARHMVETIPEEDDPIQDISHGRKPSTGLGSGSETDVGQWNVLQFNTGSTSPFIIKCGANSNSELVIKADARVQEPKGDEIVRVAPRPSLLENMGLEEMKQVFSELPEALSLLALARTADGTRARYSRLYRTLATKVPSLKDLVTELEKGSVLKDYNFPAILLRPVNASSLKCSLPVQSKHMHKLQHPIRQTNP